MAVGVTVTFLKVYIPQNYLGWVLTSIGVGLLTTLKVSSPASAWVGYQIIESIGFGILYGAPKFPIPASVNITESAHNELKKKLPQTYLDMFPGEGVEITYAAVPRVEGLAELLKREVRDAFAGSLRTVWVVMAAVSVVGFFTVLGMKQLEVHEVTDEKWGLERQKEVENEGMGKATTN
ncbi:hypothetical protein FRC00_004659 [Tulasnella sp. 408]|nr:hypothetical protein FRC00_004659 [Tulasnella sp. 408]